VKLPSGATLVTDAEVLVVGITAEVEVDLGETEETAEGETPEGEGDLVDEVGSEDAPAESESESE
jgi:large subunit ribosomal protein L25